MPESAPTTGTLTVGIVGARGHTGNELLRLLAGHRAFDVTFAVSRKLAGEPVPGAAAGCTFVNVEPAAITAHLADIYVLALPNALAAAWVDAIDAHAPDAIVLDLSADYRFDPAWCYGLPEHDDGSLRTARRIANPGCYATAMQLTARPLLEELASEPHFVGISGYSGAGTTPSPRNDPEALRDNIMPYGLCGHVHEREVAHRLGRPVRFAPHVAPFFRGLSVTAMLTLSDPTEPAFLADRFRRFHADHPLIDVADEAPLVRDAAHRNGASIGGFTVDPADPRRIAVVATLDNLLKGAASQALQNINLATGFDATEGLV